MSTQHTTAAGSAPAALAAPSARSVATELAMARYLEKHKIGGVIRNRITTLKTTTDDGMPLLAPGGTEIAHIAGQIFATVTQPKIGYQFRVSDSPAFQAWVERNAPTEVTRTITVEVTAKEAGRVMDALGELIGPGRATLAVQVRPAFADLLAEAAAKHGVTVDPRSGEFVDIPGVTIVPTNPSPTVNFTKDADQVIENAYRAGLLRGTDLASMLALPAAEDGER
ncbi:hypothetical protein GCM10027187_40900 [Streptosporangium sandarakinum]|uniref:Uncharacterized protein n=1 Tax=Streptosporangium sandarakinum TaxID=1260955 RepID=A0A852VAM0_9ACTN|nr:hypothetical protein [Streptosporangium sandarakinum]NYF44578.1 hypothetical protein [Streptosporangium sandarakinum]